MVSNVRASPVQRTARRWPRLTLVYRLALIVLAALYLGALPWDQVAALLQQPLVTGSGQPPATAVLTLVACAMALLTLNYPGRSDVSLLLVPVAAAWWHLGTPAAVLVGTAGALVGNVPRSRSALALLAAVARVVVATAAGASLAASLTVEGLPWPLTPQSLAVAGFFLAASTIDAGLDWLDGRLHGGGDAAHTDLLTNLALAPLVVFLQVVDAELGFDRLTIILAGVLALLLVVRSSVNQRTLRRVVEEEREKLATLFMQSGEGIFTIDGDLCVATLNPAMEALLGQSAAAVQGHRCAEAFGFEDAQGQRLCPDRCPLRRAQAEQHPVSEEVVYSLSEQGPKHLQLTYTAVGGPGEPLRLGIGIARDISAQKEAERLREDFVSLVTHELRSPLTVTTAYAGVLRDSLETGAAERPFDPARALRAVRAIQGASQHLLRLVDNLLDLARVERAELPLEYGEVALPTLLRESVEALAPVAQQKRVTIQLLLPPDPPPARTSALYLREILGNLLSNAIKYTPEGGRVTVSATVRTPEGGAEAPPAPEWEITVADTGYGISAQDQARLFTKFFRSGRPEVRQERGTGLGLALTKQMVERLGGNIAVRSTLGAGSTFTVTVPLAPREDVDNRATAAISTAPPA